MTSTNDRLGQLEAGTTADPAMEFYDSLPAVAREEVRGRWRGGEVPTGHPMDGLLTVSGWYGKQFDDDEHVHPLLFGDSPETIFAVNPKLAPIGLLNKVGGRVPRHSPPGLLVAMKAARTRKHRARLRTVEFRGRSTAAMIYDDLPIIDVFRKVDDDTLLGVMDLRGMAEPYFFTLRRD